MQNFSKKIGSNKGFTLIELLVVIVIIGILATGAIAVFQKSKAKAKDAQRISDIEVLIKSLQQYNTNYGYYPYNGDVNMTAWSKAGLQAVLSQFSNKWPKDAENTGGYKYVYCVDEAGSNAGQKYAISVFLERGKDATGATNGAPYIAGDNPELVNVLPTTTASAQCTGGSTGRYLTLD